MLDSINWLSTLSDTISTWSDCKNFRLIRKLINPPQSRSVIIDTLHTCMANVPDDLIQFYTESASGCDIYFNIDLLPPDQSRWVQMCGMRVRSKLSGGFGLESAQGVCVLKRELKEILAAIGAKRTAGRSCFQNAEQMNVVLDAALPIWRNQGGEYLVIVGRNPILKEGVYWIEYGSLPDPDSALLVSHSFSEWLLFLEDNLYLGTGLREASYFYDSTRKQTFGNRTLCKQIKEMANLR